MHDYERSDTAHRRFGGDHTAVQDAPAFEHFEAGLPDTRPASLRTGLPPPDDPRPGHHGYL
jgi:hypothetical protein